MAYSYTKDSIDFNNLPASGLTKLNYKPTYNNFQYAEQLGITPFVNAVEIDWNGAV